MLLETIFADLGPHERILVSHRDGAHWPRQLVSTVAEAYDYLESHQEYDVYFGVAPRVEGDFEKVERVPCVWADFDAKEFGGLAAARQALQRLAAPPTFVVCSGHGYHAYWKLSRSVTPESAQKLMRTLCTQTGADPTHNPKWRLRIPGGQNHKDPAHVVPVRLDESHTECVFPGEDLYRLCSVPSESAWLLWQTGLEKGPKSKETYPSRSERDLAVLCALVRAKVSQETIELLCSAMPFGERYREYGGLDKLRKYDLPKAQELSPKTLSSAFDIHNDCYYYKTDKGVSKVSTFVLEPTKHLRSLDGDEDVILADVRSSGKAWPNEAFERSAFNSTAQLLRRLRAAEWQWLGTDPLTRRLLPALMDYIQENDLPTAFGTKVLGRHHDCWVVPGHTFNSHAQYDTSNAPYVYVPSGRVAPEVEYTFVDDDVYFPLVQQVYDNLPKLNVTPAVLPIIGWFFATPVAPLLREAQLSFPHLNIFGTTGSGKSTTVRDVFLPLFGYTEPMQYTWTTTKFSLLALLTSTNAIPVSFSEYRARTESRQHQDFIEALRLLYDGSSDVRGRADQTTVEYHLTAPVVIDGEDALDDTTNAVRERTLLVNLHREDIAAGTDAYWALTALRGLHLSDFAGRYIRYTLNMSQEDVLQRFNNALAWAQKAFPGAPERPVKNIAVAVMGLELYNNYGLPFRANQLTWEACDFAPCLEHILLKTHTGDTRIVVDAFTEEIVRHVDLERNPRFHYHYDAEHNVLWFEAYAAYSWWKSQRRSEGREAAGWRVIQIQLDERGKMYTHGMEVREIKGQRRRCVGVDLHRAFDAGLEVPSVLNLPEEIGNVNQDFPE